ncbi:MOSC domain-containing protein [Streptomyces avicenniae]|uniref:MOSC domain-containing protein n=1 Tax=Streptomyces avicenniae TaxID=500153 RepID=UPI000699A399|nr:MOSC domain-containing protein [Streptomyces avicenniae]
MTVLTVNTGRATSAAQTDAPSGLTGIDKRPVAGPVAVGAPGPRGVGGSGLAGDTVCDLRFHGGDDQAVYAYAREDLDRWEGLLGRPLANGVFGENLTTVGADLAEVRIGERWRVGGELVLEATSPRIPCRTFASWLGESGWVKRFTADARSGVYFRVLTPGQIRAGDGVEVLHRPDHEVTTRFLFRAMTTAPELRPRVIAAGDALHSRERERARAWAGLGPVADAPVPDPA